MAGTILIIDDSENIRTTLRLTLEFKGFEVTEAVSGEEGLDRLRDGAFDLVFCDLAMPGMGGLEVIQRARTDLGLTSLPLIVLSAEAREAKDAALTAGATDLIDKPFAPDEIFRVLDQYIQPKDN